MKRYFADTNFYLRFILQDNPRQADQVEKELEQARVGKKQIVFIAPVILEMEFVLRSYYSLSTSEIAEKLLALVKTVFLEIEERYLWINILPIYAKRKIDLIDIYIFEKARTENAEVLSFDEDFRKLKKFFKLG